MSDPQTTGPIVFLACPPPTEPAVCRAVLESIAAQTVSDVRCFAVDSWRDIESDPLNVEFGIPPAGRASLIVRQPATLDPTAVECALWVLDSHPEVGLTRGTLTRPTEAKPFPNDFQAQEFLKNPGILGAAFVLRDPGSDLSATDPLVAAAEQLGRGEGLFTSQPFGRELIATDEKPAAISDPDLRNAIVESRTLCAFRPKHDRFVQVPTSPATITTESVSGSDHIVFLVPHFAMGGSDKFTLDLARGLQNDHECTVSFVSTLSRLDDWQGEFTDLSDQVYPLQRFLNRPDFPRFIAQHIRSTQPLAVIVTHSQLSYQLLPFLRAECPETPFVDYLHIDEPDWRDGGYPGLSAEYTELLDHTFTSSQHLKEWLASRGGDEAMTTVATTNIDPDDWDPVRSEQDGADLRRENEISESDALILFAGRLVEQKQPRVLAETIRELLNRGADDFTVVVAGDGPDRDWLTAFWDEHQLNHRVRMLGQVSPRAIRAWMATADIFFIPSQNEGIALANFEAMAMQCAVVGADVGGQRELISPECGTLISPEGSGEALVTQYVDALECLILEPEKRKSMGTAARQRICERFRLADAVDQILSKIRDLPQPSPPPAGNHFIRRHLNEVIEQFRLEQELFLAKAPKAALEARINKLETKLEQEIRNRLSASEQPSEPSKRRRKFWQGRNK